MWTHFDNGSCPDQAVGVGTRLDNGITGFIATKNISNKGCRRPEERVRVTHCFFSVFILKSSFLHM